MKRYFTRFISPSCFKDLETSFLCAIEDLENVIPGPKERT